MNLHLKCTRSWDFFCYWEASHIQSTPSCICASSLADLFTTLDLSNTYSPFLRHPSFHFSLSTNIYSYFPFRRFNFEKIKTRVPRACYRRLWYALQTFNCSFLQSLAIGIGVEKLNSARGLNSFWIDESTNTIYTSSSFTRFQNKINFLLKCLKVFFQ